jgi:hypothetical protein
MARRGRPRLTEEQKQKSRERTRERDRKYYHQNKEKIALRRLANYLRNPTPERERCRRYHHAHRAEINDRHRRNRQRITSIEMNDGNEKSAIATWQNIEFLDLLLSLTAAETEALGAAMDYDFDCDAMPQDVLEKWTALRVKLIDLLR